MIEKIAFLVFGFSTGLAAHQFLSEKKPPRDHVREERSFEIAPPSKLPTPKPPSIAPTEKKPPDKKRRKSMTDPETTNTTACEIKLIYHYPWKWQVFINGVDQGDIAHFSIDIEKERRGMDRRSREGTPPTYTITKVITPMIE